MRDYAILHYHEIGLKGGNRSFFEKALARNVDRTLKGLAGNTKRMPGRLLVPLTAGADTGEVIARLRRVYGIANFGLATGAEMTLEQIYEVAWDHMRRTDAWSTFAVRARIAHSSLPYTVRELNEKIGAVLLERSGAKVNLSAPDLTVHVEIVGDLVLVYADKQQGAGGLPVGVSGRSVVLISAGIDSPVAAARMMRRGSKVSFVHFHSMPYTDGSSPRQAEEIVTLLTRHQNDANLWMVPLAPSQQQIVAVAPQDLRTILYRRMMMRIAALVAGQEGAKALVTGDSLGQVASQTLENLTTVEDASPLPVLRPLIALDKIEIIDEAHRLGTFEASSAPCQEACVLFEPKRPATKASVQEARRAEAKLDVDALAREAFANAELRQYRYPEPA
ncbi:MAG TPA: tRNA uracil 4-sulfurtransferase ThiI [Actinomycetota bacterium]|nr:tRNA uracil 4-sulfurtransferase ThiI [Actinomycetota bacterium]